MLELVLVNIFVAVAKENHIDGYISYILSLLNSSSGFLGLV